MSFCEKKAKKSSQKNNMERPKILTAEEIIEERKKNLVLETNIETRNLIVDMLSRAYNIEVCSNSDEITKISINLHDIQNWRKGLGWYDSFDNELQKTGKKICYHRVVNICDSSILYVEIN